MWRYGSGNVPITAVGILLYGTIMLFAPRASYQNPVFSIGPFDLAPKPVWAIAMIASSLLALIFLTWWALFPLLAVVTCWALSIVVAGFSLPQVSPTAGITWLIIAAQLLFGVAKRGVRAHNRPKPT